MKEKGNEKEEEINEGKKCKRNRKKEKESEKEVRKKWRENK